MSRSVSIGPVTRIEGHLRIDTRIENNRIAEAWSMGEMFRGFETLLVDRDPLDAPVITQRICGVCSVSHAIASCKAVEAAIGLKAPRNGRYLRSLTLGANYLQSHILNFYHLSALDFVRVEELLDYRGKDPVLRGLKIWASQEISSGRILPIAPFLPKLPADYVDNNNWNLGALSHYLEALEIRQETHEMTSLFGGKMPHTASLVPGGVTCGVDPAVVESFRTRLRRVRRFIELTYIPDVIAAARLYPQYAQGGQGVQRYLSYGGFEEDNGDWLPAGTVIEDRFEPLDTAAIKEDLTASRFRQTIAKHPREGVTVPEEDKKGAYSWLKAPRYKGLSMEVGPLARIMVAATANSAGVGDALQAFLREANLPASVLPSVLGRHAARALEALLLSQQMETWLDALKPEEASLAPYQTRPNGYGEGLTEAPRGALGHWITIRNDKIERYQCVAPSTWNFSPRDQHQQPGPVEAALTGIEVNENYQGIEAARTVRSFDPCIACAVH
ncbi:nickel-dependent hydrogenase large subunit [Malonomonas rubra]|uniref:nickel-dependent hydrogenase large subunit n=1 Tax=Malonomonas rubra TaxID=57040 RepID=UPI0026F18BAA|nr:nickel-dependent hydrogenase large subunit [Malonomonas rubra]